MSILHHIRGLGLAVLCAAGLGSCTHSFSFEQTFRVQDLEGRAVTDADIYLFSEPMWPIPFPWLSDAWECTLDMQNQFHSSSDASGKIHVSIPRHRTFYEQSDFFILICKPGYCHTIVPITHLRQNQNITILQNTRIEAPQDLPPGSMLDFSSDFNHLQIPIAYNSSPHAEPNNIVLYYRPLPKKMTIPEAGKYGNIPRNL